MNNVLHELMITILMLQLKFLFHLAIALHLNRSGLLVFIRAHAIYDFSFKGQLIGGLN